MTPAKKTSTMAESIRVPLLISPDSFQPKQPSASAPRVLRRARDALPCWWAFAPALRVSRRDSARIAQPGRLASSLLPQSIIGVFSSPRKSRSRLALSRRAQSGRGMVQLQHACSRTGVSYAARVSLRQVQYVRRGFLEDLLVLRILLSSPLATTRARPQRPGIFSTAYPLHHRKTGLWGDDIRQRLPHRKPSEAEVSTLPSLGSGPSRCWCSPSLRQKKRSDTIGFSGDPRSCSLAKLKAWLSPCSPHPFPHSERAYA